MAHPTDTKRINGKIWHKEDSNLTLVEARSRVVNDSKHQGKYEVWWASK